MQKLLFFVFFSWISILSFSQDKPTNWKIYKQINGVNVHYKYADCDPSKGFDKELVLFKLENTTSNSMRVDYMMEIYKNEKCKTCDYPEEYHMIVDLKPNQSLEGDCTIYCDYRLKIFSEFTDPQFTKPQSKLTNFNLGNIKAVCTSCK